MKKRDFGDLGINETIEKLTTPKKKVGRPKESNDDEKGYKLTLTINSLLADYMENEQPYTTRESRKAYINRLIKQDLAKKIGANKDDSDEVFLSKYKKWKDKNTIKED